MEEIIKIVLIAGICGTLALLLGQVRPEYAPLVQIAGIVAVLALAAESIAAALRYVQTLLPQAVTGGGYVSLLIKTVCIAVIAKLGADLCRDAGSSALGFAVETAGKAAILLLCLPMLKNLSEILLGLLKG